jgi:hypothetical protein
VQKTPILWVSLKISIGVRNQGAQKSNRMNTYRFLGLKFEHHAEIGPKAIFRGTLMNLSKIAPPVQRNPLLSTTNRI